MNKVKSLSALRVAVSEAKKEKQSVGFVPTMGNLHEGHLALVKRAKQMTDFVVVSIYVNITQFEQNEDFANYPNTLENDICLLADLDVDIAYVPTQELMYPGEIESQTVVHVPKIANLYCGKDRPNHFHGVTTVVSRLFNMVQPNVAIFGKKDYQQLAIIKKMVKDLSYPVDVIGVDTVRAKNGLALSSRNGYLTNQELSVAHGLYLSLLYCVKELKKGEMSIEEIENKAAKMLEKLGFKPQFVSIARQEDLQAANKNDKKLVVLAAAYLGKARLIDNMEVAL